MNGAVPRRVDVVFVGLVVLTCVTWWLGSDRSPAADGFDVAATLTILIAVVKMSAIGWDFMELRGAPTLLRTVSLCWALVFTISAVALVVI